MASDATTSNAPTRHAARICAARAAVLMGGQQIGEGGFG